MEFITFHIGFYELASIGTLFSGMPLVVLLLLSKRGDRRANLFLSLAIVAIILKVGCLIAFCLPLVGPLWYFFVRRQTDSDKQFRWWDSLHFWPLPAAYLIALPWLALISNIGYLYLSYRLIRGFYSRLKPVLMDKPRFTFRRLEKVHVLLGLLCLCWPLNDLFSFATVYVLFGVAAGKVLQPDGNGQSAASLADRSDVREKSRRLKEAVVANRLYADAELTLSSLAVKLTMHPHDLSRIINTGLNRSFNDFINELRVREIARKMQDPSYNHFTLLGIAYESGFNSQRTFNRVFKEMTGKTPAEYKKSLEKEWPTHKLAVPLGIRPVILRQETLPAWTGNTLKRNYMFRNYFKTAFRNLLHSKVYSFINIAGLSIGLACAMLILLYVQDEVSFDRFHQNAGQIYRIDKQMKRDDGSINNGSYTGYFPGPRFAAKIPEIQSFVRFQPSEADIKTGTDIRSQAICLVDANFLSVFNFPLLTGDARSALTEPNSVVITEDIAKKYFGSADALGKIISVKNDGNFKPLMITGVARNCPENSSIKFQVLLRLSVSAADESNNGNWFNSFLSTFVVLSPGANIKTVQDKMNKVFESDASKAISEIKNKYHVQHIGQSYMLEPLTGIHLGKIIPNEDEILSDKSNPEFSYILSAIAVFVLLIACINFINLTVARSVKRAKEIGIRKVIGGTSRQLRFQFLSESFVLCFIAFLFAFAIVVIVLPFFNSLANKALSLSYLFSPKLIIDYIVLFIVTGLLAGAYPSMILSGYRPVETLYSRFNLGGKNGLQKALVIFQFALASFLIIGAMAIYLQFDYLTTQKLGYDDSHLITVDQFPLSADQAALFRQELIKDPDIIDAAPRNGGYNNNTVKVNGDQSINVSVETVDAAYVPLLKIPLLAGRNFSAEYSSDRTSSVLVNEAFVQQAGWKQAIGQQISSFENETYQVIGVVKDYHYRPLTEKILPQLFTTNPANDYGMMYIRIRPGTETASLQHISKKFKELFPLSPFSYNFKQDQNQQSYTAEARWKGIILFSAVLTIFISCIGLLGLSVLAVEKRVKEIGVRKILGASADRIVMLLSAGFLKLILIALVISIPFAWIATNKWLQYYPYRIALNWWLFASGGILVIFIALITISFQSVKAAITNPVKNLRTE
ncbi:ABC transporter permease [Mucilaginibacter endophyticus]|uniref:ABC transporter permease n=1 Tax=Mucilaginibacter endophyticus TaxID=2675003 RepID=UPI000E0DCFEF|nr:ABC transporter permease [Mucilaginibacter endophyticus]